MSYTADKQNAERARGMVDDHKRLHGGFERADARRTDALTESQERDLGRARETDPARVDSTTGRPASPQEGRANPTLPDQRPLPTGKPGNGELKQVVRGEQP